MIIIFEIIDVKTKKFLFMEILGAIVVSAMAVIFHNLYDLTDRNFYLGLISATNESVFEHIKIIFFPYLIWSIIEYILLKPDESKKFITIKLIVLCVISSLVVIFYYTYVGIIGYNIMALDIASAFIYVIIGFIWSYKWITSKGKKNIYSTDIFSNGLYYFSIVLFVISIVSLIYFTINPIKIPLFYDTESKIYGMK